jgi:UDP-N-acetylglucosamine 2-epimerase (non-hydrolysing)
VDDAASLGEILATLQKLSTRLPVLFPVHPRTKARMDQIGFRPTGQLRLAEPLGYLDFLSLMATARFLLTDSGGIQEETTALGVPCFTLRANTERPITITEGTNRLLGTDPASIIPAAEALLVGKAAEPRCPALWDGRAGERIAATLDRYLAAD